MSGDHQRPRSTETATQSVQMLKAVIEGEAYETVAERFGVSRTAVERRIKAIAIQLCKVADIKGLNEDGASFVSRLRQHRDALLVALVGFEPRARTGKRQTRVVSVEEITQAATRIKGRTSRPAHDLALFFLLFVTGSRPLEIARLEVRDYLNPDGSVRRISEMRAEVAIIGKVRPLHFASTRLNAVLGSYLQERLDHKLGLGATSDYRGLDPCSRLFLSPTGEGFKIAQNGAPGQRRFLCRAILELYEKLFRYADLRGVTALSVRHTVISRLYARGADDDQVGLILGISERSAVRGLFPRTPPTIEELLHEMV